jgi:hypothetical protein
MKYVDDDGNTTDVLCQRCAESLTEEDHTNFFAEWNPYIDELKG